MGNSVGHAKAPNVTAPGDVAVPASGSAVTFGKKTAIPSGYYQFCKTANAVCRTSRGGGDHRVENGVVRVDARLLKELGQVNADVNRAIRPVEDSVQYHVVDRWSVAPKKGDCEDFALTKKSRLLKLGWPSSALLIALANAAAGAEHAVLIARTDRGDFVLDNIRKDVRPWSAGLYRWKSIQAPSDVWVWYQFGGGTVRVASNTNAAGRIKVLKVSTIGADENRFLGPEDARRTEGAASAANFASVIGPIVDAALQNVIASASALSFDRLKGRTKLADAPVPEVLNQVLAGATTEPLRYSPRWLE